MRALAIVALGAALGACDRGSGSTKDQRPSAAGPDAGEGAATFATVFLRERVDGRQTSVDVVARGAPTAIHGVAFRLRWEPGELAFIDARASGAWSSATIRLAKEGLPGELVVVWTEKGGAAGVRARGETLLGTIAFSVTEGDRAKLAFRPDRSTMRDAAGRAIEAEWIGAELASTPR